MAPLTIKSLLLSTVFITGSALANCGAGSLFDGSICHYQDSYGDLYSKQGGNGSNQAPKDYWGAIAIDVVKGNTSGSAQNLSSKITAETNAIQACNSRNCRIVATYKNSCGAVATNDQGIRLGTFDTTPTQAERKALALCNKESDIPCKLWIKAKCSGVGY